ncbi:transcription termination factor Rho [Brevifollis gellanilyticus]|nr:transcription termination factor Rho [Brevifollis gellanilyticus]
MSTELQPEEKPKKKAAAKKVAAKKAAPAPAKKAAVKKVAAKKVATKKPAKVIEPPAELELNLEVPAAPETANADVPAKKTRRTALQKKAAEILAKMQESMVVAASAPVEAAPAPVANAVIAAALDAEPMSAPEAAVEVPPPAFVKAAPAAVPAPAARAAAPAASEDDSDEGGDDEPPQEGQSGGAGDAGGGQDQGRKKTRWERWKERRERFKAEKAARRLAQQGGGQGGHQGGGDRDRGHVSAERSQGGYQPQHSNGGHQPQQNGRHAQSHRDTHDDDAPMSPEVVLGPPEASEGVLEMNPKGHGFLRSRERMFAQHPADPFVHADTVRQLGLREGMLIKGISQKGPRGLMVTSITDVNGRTPESVRDLPLFEELKAINPNKRIQFETTKERITTRVIDMFTPVGRGQRGLIVAPPRTGKTTLLQHIAESIVQNHPSMHLIILLVDERPEEVTEFKRIFANAEVYASSNDQDVRSHTRIAMFAIERAKRLVEAGEHVFLLMDSITRLARAFNNAKSGGATMSGGMAVGGMEIPRRLFAAARNTRGAGSLTILATALIETGSKMDDVIFLEFKGTGNMELVLDRKLAEQYYYPAVNIFKSGTRREELLLQSFQLDKIHMLRRGLAGGKPIDAIQRVITLCERYPSNAQMLVDLPGKA